MGRYKEIFTLFKRGKYYYYRTYTPTGKRTTAKTTGKTSKGAAQAYCNELYKQGELYRAKIIFRRYAEHFFDTDSLFNKDRPRPLSPNTLKNYKITLEKYIMPVFGDYELGDINYSMLKEFRANLCQKYANKTAIIIMHCLKQVIDDAYRDGLLNKNPFEYLGNIQNVNKKNRDSFYLEEIVYLYETVDPRLKDLILALSLTGLRIGEALGVTPEDIKEGDGYYYLSINKQRDSKTGEYLPPKCGSAREVPIIPEIKELITPNLSCYSYIYYNFLIRPSIKELLNSEERLLCFHSFRHFFITSAKSWGVPSVKVETIVGHKLSKIEAVYTNFKAGDLLEILAWQKEFYKKIKRKGATKEGIKTLVAPGGE